MLRPLDEKFEKEGKEICLAWLNDPQERDIKYFIETMASPEYKEYMRVVNAELDEKESRLIASG